VRWITEDAKLVCDHGGRVSIVATQNLVRIAKRRVLVRPDPEARPIASCPNANPPAGILPCKLTLQPRAGYSGLVRILGQPVCLDSLLGYTDGSPPRVTNYTVVDPAQQLVQATA
jgi:hypothetical protein